MQFWDNGKYGNGCTSVCNLRVQWMYALQNQITVVRASHILLFIILLVLSLSVSGWGACVDLYSNCSSGGVSTCEELPCYGKPMSSCPWDYPHSAGQVNGSCSDGPQWNYYYRCCNNKVEADSVKCAINPSAEGCSTPCSAYQAQCDAAKGKFSGKVGPDGKCSASCDLCNKESIKKIYEIRRQQCCDQMKAPPPEVKICSTPIESGPGMTSSEYNGVNGMACEDPNLDSLTSERYYQMCYDYDPDASSDSNPGSGSSGSGDSTGTSSGAQYPEGCDECPWLDSILDTLTLQKGKVDAIYDCLTLPGLCDDKGDTLVVNVDSAILKYVQPYLDSSVRLDSAQLRALAKLDTNMLKAMRNDSAMMRNDSAALDNDTMIYRAITDAGYTNDTNLIRLKDRVFHMDTVNRHRLDSIIRKIPSDVLDSIRKYQDSTMDRIDTALWGKGVGFSLIDSLVDSTVKYFKASNHYDSVYNKMFHDFDSTLMGKLDNMEVTGELGLDGFGYGDTASKSLRDDIEGLRDGVDSLLGVFGEGSADNDNTYDGYLTGYDTAAVQFASNLGSALSGALADSTYNGIFVLDSSTVGLDTGYRVIDLDSAQQALQASNDSVKSALADTMQTWFNELRNDFMLVNFDSAIIAPLGAKVPNTNTCPEECFKIDLSGAGGAFSDVKGFSWGLCDARIGNMNVLQFIRLILRIVTALTCVYIGLWFISGRKS